MVGGGITTPVSAGFLSFIGSFTPETYVRSSAATENSQTIDLLSAPLTHNPKVARGGATVLIEEESLTSPLGPGATFDGASAYSDSLEEISVYVVESGDTLSSIAGKFGISTATIRGVNQLSGTKIAVGQKLTILPTDGVLVKVKSGDTVSSLAKRYKGETSEIVEFNGLDADSPVLVAGDQIVIPGGVLPVVVAAKPRGSSLPAGSFGFVRPVSASAGRITQRTHGSHNGIDIGAPSGTPVYAVSGGRIVVARAGYNGGYGTMIVQDTSAGFQVLYGHLSRLAVSPGDEVSAGQIIGYVGNTGRSTGSHLHYEERGSGRANSMLSAY